jgi:hypothetical protein
VRERDTDMGMVEEQVLGEFVFHNALDIVEDAATKSTGEPLSNFKTTGLCANLIHNTASNPRTMVIDFGNTNCLCNDNHNRKGKILVSYSGNKLTDVNNQTKITFQDYYLDNNQIIGSSVITNKDSNLLKQPYAEIIISGKMLKPNTVDTLIFNATRTRTWTKGFATPIYGDDEFEMVGNGTGTSYNQGYYSMNITKPIVKNAQCHYFLTGKFDLQPQGKSVRIVDYGKGDCDDKATSQLNTKSFGIQLP